MTADLDILLACMRAYLAHRASLPKGTVLSDGPWDATLLRCESAATQVELVLEHPIRSALKGYVRDVGWRVADEGGINAMLDLHGEVEAAMGRDAQFVGNLLEVWWHGIGRAGDRRWLA